MQTEVTRSLPVPLTDAEVADRVRDADERIGTVATLIGKAAQLAKDKKTTEADIDHERREIDRLVKIANAREEHRDVECRWLYDLASSTATLSRVDTGELVEQRALTTEERKELEQRPLQFGDTPPAGRRTRRQTETPDA